MRPHTGSDGGLESWCLRNQMNSRVGGLKQLLIVFFFSQMLISLSPLAAHSPGVTDMRQSWKHCTDNQWCLGEKQRVSTHWCLRQPVSGLDGERGDSVLCHSSFFQNCDTRPWTYVSWFRTHFQNHYTVYQLMCSLQDKLLNVARCTHVRNQKYKRQLVNLVCSYCTSHPHPHYFGILQHS